MNYGSEPTLKEYPDMLLLGAKTIDDEIAALLAMKSRLGDNFSVAVNIIYTSTGKIVVVGMGKSGIIGKKIAATLASTGTPSFFVHPGEAFHGDLGMIQPNDVALLISNSGETEEVLRLLPFFEYQKNKIISLTGKVNSTLAQRSDVVLDVGVKREACPNDLAPTSSTTCTLVMGDALAVALTNLRDFQPQDFAKFHPGGLLGRRLLSRVRDAMTKSLLPFVDLHKSILDVIHVMTKCRLGVALVMEHGKLVGIITDGDLRRAIELEGFSNAIMASDIMNREPQTVDANEMLVTAEERMRQNRIGCLVVTDADKSVVGVLQIFD
jgi:arabinose-5-phosphate isomerase